VKVGDHVKDRFTGDAGIVEFIHTSEGTNRTVVRVRMDDPAVAKCELLVTLASELVTTETADDVWKRLGA
jgi:hypothetical protein